MRACNAAGEVGNILAGNLKCLFPVRTEISIPTVVEVAASRKLVDVSALSR